MATILGARSVGNLTSDERPKDWETAHLVMYPNGSAPLVAVLSQITASKVTGDPEFNWWQRGMTARRFDFSGTANTSDTTFDFTYPGTATDAAVELPVGTLLRSEVSGEVVIVTANSGSSPVTVKRAIGSTAASVADNDGWMVLGSAYEEGSGSPDGATGAPTKYTNLCQIFKQACEETRTSYKTTTRWLPQGTYKERLRETLERFSLGKEQQYRWGTKAEDTGPNGKPRRFTGGIYHHLSAAVTAGLADSSQLQTAVGTLTETAWDQFLEKVFLYGSNERFAMANNQFMGYIQRIGKGRLDFCDPKETYGMKITAYMHQQGTIYFRHDALFNSFPSASFGGMCWLVDFAQHETLQLKERYIDRTFLRTNIQLPDADSRKDMYQCETGLQVPFAERFGIMQGVTDFSVVG